MAPFNGEVGLQFVTHLANHYSVPELTRLASLAERKGFQQIWLNDHCDMDLVGKQKEWWSQ